MSKVPWLIRICGGRKYLNGYITAFLLTLMAALLKGSFEQYALFICLAMGVTSGMSAWEDRAKHQNGVAK